MNFLEERIVKDGIVKEGNVLKVDSFLNHQMDIALIDRIGEEFYERFKRSGPFPRRKPSPGSSMKPTVPRILPRQNDSPGW